MTRLASTVAIALACGLGCSSGEGAFAPAGSGAASASGGGDGGADASSGGLGGNGGSGDAGGGGGAPGLDADGDGLDDLGEEALAAASLPFLSLHPDDDCPLAGVLYRVSPHPADAGLRMIWYVTLFEQDCGLNGHVGDDEVFGVVVDPRASTPASILAVRAISHQGTACQQITTCGSLPGCSACTTAGSDARPVVFYSRDKHGSYVKEDTCDGSLACDFGGCQLAASPTAVPLLNAGEPAAPLVDDLTDQGFITDANGWTAREVMHFDPWSGGDFGSAGNVGDDLQDAAFVVDPEGC